MGELNTHTDTYLVALQDNSEEEKTFFKYTKTCVCV